MSWVQPTCQSCKKEKNFGMSRYSEDIICGNGISGGEICGNIICRECFIKDSDSLNENWKILECSHCKNPIIRKT